MARRADRLARAAGLALLLALSVGAGAQAVPVPAAGVGRVDFSAKLQRIDGFGFSEAFGEAAAIERLPEPRRREVLDLLFSRERGAGFSMLRLGIETGSTIEPEAPAGGAAGKPGYVWDGSDLGDGGQVWLARQAKAYGVTQFVADAWMAPAFMKTTGKRIGGVLCGLRDAAVCASGDWRRAYAEYLLAYVGFYRRAGVPVSSLGFSNEPELHVSYESMLFSPAQLAEMLGVLGPLARRQMPALRLTCCDGSKWTQGQEELEAIEASPAKGYLDVVTAHEYGAHATVPLKTGALQTERPVWMTEWSSAVPAFEPRWDCSGCFGMPDGMSLAGDVLRALRDGGVNAYLGWWAAADQPAALIQLKDGGYTVAKRLYALAMVSRFVQPGASRVAADAGDPEVDAVGFLNPDGSRVLVLLNRGRLPKEQRFAVAGGEMADAGRKSWVTDERHSFERVEEVRGEVPGAGASMTLALPARSLTTVVWRTPRSR